MREYIRITGIEDILDRFDKRKSAIALSRAMNRIGGKSRSGYRKWIREDYNLKLSAIQIYLRKAAASSLSVTLKSPNRQVNALRFTGTKQTSGGVQVQIHKGKVELLTGAFVEKPKGRDWKKYGQKRIINSNNSFFIFKRESSKAYPLKKIDTVNLGAKLLEYKPQFEKQTNDIKTIVLDELTYLIKGKRK